jgi:hypothetical protein
MPGMTELPTPDLDRLWSLAGRLAGERDETPGGVFEPIGLFLHGPVVMTVPMMFDAPNHVLGEDLREFLSLGCRVGCFGLEQLAYRRDETVAAIQAAEATSDPLLLALTRELDLRPWSDVAGRLSELERRGF